MNHPGTYIAQLITGVGNLIKIALPIAAGLALLVFFWGLARFIFASGSEKAITEGRSRMVWGIVALFVMVSVWGLTSLLRVMLGLDAYTPPQGSDPRNSLVTCGLPGQPLCDY